MGFKPLSVSQGAALDLGVTYRDDDGNLVDMSSGWAARFIAKESFDAAAAILDYTDAGSEITLSDGSGGTNIDILVGKTVTEALACLNGGVYELRVWPTSNAEQVTRLLYGSFGVERGV